MVHFEKFFEDFASKLDILTDAAKLLDEKIEVINLEEVINECTDFLKKRIEAEFNNGRSNLKVVLNEDGDEAVKPFIANFYNLVSFENKMHKLINGKLLLF